MLVEWAYFPKVTSDDSKNKLHSFFYKSSVPVNDKGFGMVKNEYHPVNQDFYNNLCHSQLYWYCQHELDNVTHCDGKISEVMKSVSHKFNIY